ncbi:MAG: glycosyl hydrolase family 39 [Acidobacteriaceae bacterium]|nr:glycosyl hydrolase family 39 [Acidobacteriaceae bacterium]MBV9500401.1 glycosyl hydrolase family 39 [Acidobacteriaceae bacterium]
MKSLSVGLACLLAVFWRVPALKAQAPSEETITIDPNGTSHPFPHFWEQMFGSGRANLSLRESYRIDLRAVKNHTGFTYIRFHAILDDENGVYSEDAAGRPVYNFSYLDEIYDGLLADHVKPFVEISFMPQKLAANLKPHPFWYKPLPSPPNDPAKWDALMMAFAAHLIERYGKDEVESWYFEVWNEPNIDFWDGEPKQSTYFALYDETARALKSVDSNLRVGGPATAQAAWVADFIAHCTREHVPFDFVSTHVYGNDTSQDVFGRKLDIPRKDMVARAAKKVYDEVKASAAPKTPIIWSEYNATYMNQTEVTDSAFMGPWLANHIRESDGLAAIMAYWCFSDVFEEQGVVKTPFYGGYGLIAERHLPKSAFWAFELLHRLGNRRLEIPSENALATVRDEGAIVLALWNYAEPGEHVPDKSFRLVVKGKAGTYRLRFIDPDHGSGLKAWKDVGSPISPRPEQTQAIQKAAALARPQEHPIGDPINLIGQGLAVVEIP